MIYDFKDMNTQSISQEERKLFMQSQRPPDGWVISIGFLDNTISHGKVWKRSAYAFEDPQNVVMQKCNTQSTTLAAGRLLIHVYSDTLGGRLAPRDVQSRLSLEVIWPTLNWPIQRPSRVISNGAGFNLIAKAAHSIIAAKAYSVVPTIDV